MKDWNKELFIRVPKDLFDDPLWNNGEFTKKEASFDLYSLAHDSPNNKGAIVDINEVPVSIKPGDVIRGYRSLSERWGWSTKKVGKFLKDYSELGYFRVIRKHPCTVIRLACWIPRRKHGGNTAETEGRQLDSNYNKNNKESGNESLLSFDKYQKQFPDVDVNKSLNKYLDYTDNPTQEGATRWLKHEKRKKKPEFRKTPTGYTIAYCSKCGHKEFPNNERQIREGSSCCRVEYVPKREEIVNATQKERKRLL